MRLLCRCSAEKCGSSHRCRRGPRESAVCGCGKRRRTDRLRAAFALEPALVGVWTDPDLDEKAERAAL